MAQANNDSQTGNYGGALAMLASLFFMWGFITVINNTLLPHLRSVFDLTYVQTTLIESTWFIAYFVASIPSAKLIEKIGYKPAIIVGLAVMAFGSLLMIPAARIPSYWVVLIALFIVASGIALLQVAANPYVTVIGSPKTASSRLNLVQAFNSMGTTFAPLFGGYLILSRSVSGNQVEGAAALTQAERLADAQSVQLPYLIVTVALWKFRNLVWAVPAIFIYLIAEIGVSNLFINFVSGPSIGNMSHAEASNYLFILWGGMMVGRFAGAYAMRTIAPEKVLATVSLCAFIVMLITTFASGQLAMWALISVGLFHSIMFPTIFTLGIKGLGPLTEEGSGLLIMAIAGGALVIVQGWLADMYGLQLSFLLTAACELYVLWYALWGSKVTNPEPPEKLEGA
jgi:FHS family L-fucose permease-like MFS transporter